MYSGLRSRRLGLYFQAYALALMQQTPAGNEALES